MTTDGEQSDGHLTDPASSGRNDAPVEESAQVYSGATCLFAPYRHMLNPRKCGLIISKSPGYALAFYLFGLLFIGASVLLGVIIDRMYEWNWNFSSATGTTSDSVNERGMMEAWRSLGSEYISPSQVTLMIFGMTCLWTIIATIVFAWIALPMIHRSGSALRSFGRSFRIAMGIVGPASVIVFAMSLSFSLFINEDESRWGGPGPSISSLVLDIWLGGNIIACWLAVALLGAWMRRAAIGARPTTALPDTPITCEACGYDLTHLPESGRCTECGTDTSISIDPAVRRVGIEWEREPTASAWLAAIVELLANPKSFYQKLRMRDGEASGFTFAFVNYVAIGLASMGSTIGMFLKEEPHINLIEWLGVLTFGSVFPAVGAWFIHVVIGALVATLVLFRTQARPFAFISKIWQYESAYLWVILIVAHGFAWSFLLFEDWFSDLLRVISGGSVWFFVEPLLVLASIVVLLVGWMIRYRRAVDTTRWANL